jgi:hypothetical protein
LQALAQFDQNGLPLTASHSPAVISAIMGNKPLQTDPNDFLSGTLGSGKG